MSPKDFRKICHPEVKILKSLVNCGQTDRHSDRHSDETRCRADPTSSGSAKNKMPDIQQIISFLADPLEVG